MSELRTNRIVPRDGLPSGSSGGIIQVRSTTLTTTATYAISGMTWTEVSGLTTTITPTRSDSKILCMVSIGAIASNGNNQRYGMALRRGSTNIGVNSDGSSHTRANWCYTGRDLGNAPDAHISYTYLDSPASTSAQTYKVMITTEGSYTLYINRSSGDSDSSSVFRAASTFTLMEISG
tara:strand:- start:1549 stop:2082 length:534 start_codon:yes stop_codon:yes gene_type:complete